MKDTQELELISVIMPCYNAGEHLCKAIDCVLSQTYQHVELIIIDDGSTDNSREILDRYHSKVVALSQTNQGPYPARNLGLRHAKGEFIAFLDADDWWDNTFLEKMHAALVSSNAALSYCGWQNIASINASNDPYIPPEYDKEDLVKHFIKGCPWPIHAALVRKGIVDRVGGFSERYFTSMDYDFWLRASVVTKNIVRVPESLAYYRWHNKGQISSTVWRQAINSWNVRRDFIANNPDLVQHISPKDLKILTNGYLLKKAYTCYWNRDLVSAQRLFRKVLLTGGWKLNDLKYLLPSLLTEKVYRLVVGGIDKARNLDTDASQQTGNK